MKTANDYKNKQIFGSPWYCGLCLKNMIITVRSSRLQMFFEVGVLKNIANFTGKQLCWSLF